MAKEDKALTGAGLGIVSRILETLYVPLARKINGKVLSKDITLNASDVGAATISQVNDAVSEAINSTSFEVKEDGHLYYNIGGK